MRSQLFNNLGSPSCGHHSQTVVQTVLAPLEVAERIIGTGEMDGDTIHQRVLRTGLAVAADGHGHAPPTLFCLRDQQQYDSQIGHRRMSRQKSCNSRTKWLSMFQSFSVYRGRRGKGRRVPFCPPESFRVAPVWGGVPIVIIEGR
jgi:hypothetical protein